MNYVNESEGLLEQVAPPVVTVMSSQIRDELGGSAGLLHFLIPSSRSHGPPPLTHTLTYTHTHTHVHTHMILLLVMNSFNVLLIVNMQEG